MCLSDDIYGILINGIHYVLILIVMDVPLGRLISEVFDCLFVTIDSC